MQAIVEPGRIYGSIAAPASKSIMQRVCAAALLHHGQTVIHAPGRSDDDIAALNIIQRLGAAIVSQTDDRLTIMSNGIFIKEPLIDCGESGLAARLFTPVAAISAQAVTITGHGSLLQRPMETFLQPLTELKVRTPDFSGKMPFVVQGPLQPVDMIVDGAVSSQYLSGLLFAVAHAATAPVTITVHDLKSKPYIDLTLSVLAHFGRLIKHDGYERFYIDPALFADKKNIEITIPGDWSGAAFLFAAGAIAGEVSISGLDTDSSQADRAILGVLTAAGADVSYMHNRITVRRKQLHGFDIDVTDCPDLFPVLAILAACARGDSNIKGLHRLFHKESNRAESISEMLQQYGVFFSIENDTLYIEGKGRLEGATIDSYNDHRIAMASLVGALHATHPVVIENAQCVSKSYPDFFKDLAQVGAKVMQI